MTTDRIAAMAAMYRDGQTLHEIGAAFGVTRQRVQQLLSRRGVTAADGGLAVRTSAERASRAAARDRRYLKKWGHDYAAHQALLRLGREQMRRGVTRERTPIGAFINQRSNASHRGIEWQLLLADWWRIWSESGHWCDRGRGRGKFVMSRRGDVGPYAAWNVFIQLATLNNSDRPSKKSRLPIGVCAHRRNGVMTGRYIASAMIKGRNRTLGYFSTIEEASAAYQRACAKQQEAA